MTQKPTRRASLDFSYEKANKKRGKKRTQDAKFPTLVTVKRAYLQFLDG